MYIPLTFPKHPSINGVIVHVWCVFSGKLETIGNCMGASSPLLADGCWVAMRHRDTEGKLCIKGNNKLPNLIRDNFEVV